jgi:hypothetical protein
LSSKEYNENLEALFSRFLLANFYTIKLKKGKKICTEKIVILGTWLNHSSETFMDFGLCPAV